MSKIPIDSITVTSKNLFGYLLLLNREWYKTKYYGETIIDSPDNTAKRHNIAQTKGSNKMKKTIALLFSAALICGAFTACGKKEKGSSTTESSTMAPTDSDFGLNSATDASQESQMDITQNSADTSRVGTANTPTNNESSEGLIDGIVSDAEDAVDDAGSAIEHAGDAFTGDDH